MMERMFSPVKFQIRQTLPTLDRCCSLNGKVPEFDGFDNFERISSKDISVDDFNEKYAKKREVVILENCLDDWPAKNWTIKGKDSICSVFTRDVF